MNNEIWKPLACRPCYEVSTFGRIRRNGKILKQAFNEKGYAHVCLTVDGERKTERVHKLILLTFVGPRPPGFHGCHYDGNRKNNHVSNLGWVTVKENMAHKIIHGTRQTGEKHGRSKLTEKQVKEIRASHQWRKVTYKMLAKKYNVHWKTIGQVITRRYWKHTP